MFTELFTSLRQQNYSWQPLRPERLLKLRAEPEAFDLAVQRYGLGLGSDVAVSRYEDLLIAHDHWPAVCGREYVYLGEESFHLARVQSENVGLFRGKSVLDLGSGAGLLSLVAAGTASRVLGLDSCARAVEWSRASAAANGITNAEFQSAAIGTPQAEAFAGGRDWDFVVSNPPMAVPTDGDHRPHRDGGRLGIELPLLFLDFAGRHLRSGGEVYMHATNPIVRGKGLFLEKLKRRNWAVLESKCLDDRFNSSLYRKEGYDKLGIERVELLVLHLRQI